MLEKVRENVLEKKNKKKFIKYSGAKFQQKYLAQIVNSPNTTFWQKMKDFYFSKILSVKLLGKKNDDFLIGKPQSKYR